MDKVFGTYICTGCGIGDAVDMDALTAAASEIGMEAKTHEALCQQAGRDMIQADVDGGVNTVVVCACSPRVMKDEFNFGEDKITVRANLREGAVWSAEKPSDDRDADTVKEFTSEIASDYVRMACTQAQKTELPEPFQLETLNKKILVMGGGIAGLTAAKEAAKAGYEVTVVEKAAQLGGKALGWAKQFPTKAPYAELEEPTIGAMIADVEGDGNITVKTATEIARIGGAPCDFNVTMKSAGEASEWDAPVKVGVDEQDKIDKGEMEDPNDGLKPYMEQNDAAEKFGAVVLATGWVPADVSEYEHLGHGTNDKVIPRLGLVKKKIQIILYQGDFIKENQGTIL